MAWTDFASKTDGANPLNEEKRKRVGALVEGEWRNPQYQNRRTTNCEQHRRTHLELGLGMAGSFFPFSPFPSYCFPRAVVFDILRNAGLFPFNFRNVEV